MARYNGDYALYKGEELIAVGTSEELAKQFGVKDSTIRFYSTPTNAKRNKSGNKLTAVKLDEED